MQPVTGHPCPRCGCQDARRNGHLSRWGYQVDRLQCRHCGALFRAPKEEARPAESIQSRPEPPLSTRPADAPSPIPSYCPAIPAISPRCPKCGGDTRVISTQRPTRWHRCKDCEHSFQSYERARQS